MLSLSTTVGYAILAVACLGQTPGKWKQVADVAYCTGVPEAYLRKVLKSLADQGLLSAKRGYRGGYMLARPPDEINVLDIVDAIDGVDWFSRCLLGYAECSDERACPTHEFWKKERATIREALRSVTPADAERDLLSRCLVGSGTGKSMRDSGRTAQKSTKGLPHDS